VKVSAGRPQLERWVRRVGRSVGERRRICVGFVCDILVMPRAEGILERVGLGKWGAEGVLDCGRSGLAGSDG